VRLRLASGSVTRHAAPTSIAQARVSAEVLVLLLIAMIAGSVLVSSWYTAAGASVLGK